LYCFFIVVFFLFSEPCCSAEQIKVTADVAAAVRSRRVFSFAGPGLRATTTTFTPAKTITLNERFRDVHRWGLQRQQDRLGFGYSHSHSHSHINSNFPSFPGALEPPARATMPHCDSDGSMAAKRTAKAQAHATGTAIGTGTGTRNAEAGGFTLHFDPVAMGVSQPMSAAAAYTAQLHRHSEHRQWPHCANAFASPSPSDSSTLRDTTDADTDTDSDKQPSASSQDEWTLDMPPSSPPQAPCHNCLLSQQHMDSLHLQHAFMHRSIISLYRQLADKQRDITACQLERNALLLQLQESNKKAQRKPPRRHVSTQTPTATATATPLQKQQKVGPQPHTPAAAKSHQATQTPTESPHSTAQPAVAQAQGLSAQSPGM
jgi:hypothetical protein